MAASGIDRELIGNWSNSEKKLLIALRRWIDFELWFSSRKVYTEIDIDDILKNSFDKVWLFFFSISKFH